MPAPRPQEDPDDDLPPAEAARARRRDHDAAAGARTGMRTGLAKQFKQVLDAQARRGREAAERRDGAEPERPRRKPGHRATGQRDPG